MEEIMKKLLSLLLLGLMPVPLFSQTEMRLLRFPAIHQDRVAFSYAGDLYLVAATGGLARKITSHPGYEMFPHFSPDGKSLAFTAQYDGNTEVYVMPAEGGVPQRLTYTATLDRDEVSDRMGPNNIVMGWTHDGQKILFRSRMKEFNDFKGQLYYISIKGGLPEQLPLPRGGFASLSSDDQQLAYNRIFREFRTWKRYRGGMADDIWLYDFSSKKSVDLTGNPALDIFPMWHENRIYFLSDRDPSVRLNLYVCDLADRSIRQLTHFDKYDCKFPSLGDQAIVFENGGYLYRFDLSSEKTAQIPVALAEDLASGRTELVDVNKNITNYEISPDGQRALFGARGDIFTVPQKNGPIRNLTQTPGVHERNSVWSPDGKYIAYISDLSGEDEIYIRPADGRGAVEQLTKNGDSYKYAIIWSPDSRKILWADKKLRLQFVDLQSHAIQPVDQAEMWEFNEYVWSPDGQWIAYNKTEREMMNRIYFYSLEKKSSLPVTDGWFSCSNPLFSSDGNFFFFTSERDFNPIYSQTEWNHAYRDMDRIYLMTLSKATASPFRPKSDEVGAKDDKTKNETAGKDKKENKPETAPPLKIDPDGLMERIAGLPIAASDYRSLASVEGKLYYIRKGSKDEKSLLLMYDFKELKETELGQADGYEISADRKKMLISQAGSYAIIDLPSARMELKDKLNLAGMDVSLDRKAEWRQIFNETWRQMRDFFYAPNMNGVDWSAVREKYAPLIPFVNHRADLTYVIGEMIGELNSGHCYVGGGDLPQPRRIKTGLLGAELERDASGYYRIAKILKGQNWQQGERSPLTEIGVDANEGDYIIAVDGVSTREMTNIYAALISSVSKQVRLTINQSPSETGSRDIVIVPITDESSLYYHNWVQKNIARVNAATNGRVGYLHVPDMGVHGLNEFAKYYYPQLQKKALIIDDRGNGGGNVSPMIIERLQREITMFTFARNTLASPAPEGMLWGPKICLIDEFSASDGDLFPYQFKTLKMGKLVGKRTWGGVVGIRGSLPLLDGGFLNKPEFSRFGLDGKSWIIEGVGVEPDVEVDNDPALEFSGVDQQLDRAIELILEELKSWDNTVPAIPPYPVK